MLAEAANGAAAEWDAEHHKEEHVGTEEPGMAGRDGLKGSSSTALDTLGKSSQADYPPVSSPQSMDWHQHEAPTPQLSPPQQQVMIKSAPLKRQLQVLNYWLLTWACSPGGLQTSYVIHACGISADCA